MQGGHDDGEVPLPGGPAAHVHQAPHAGGPTRQRQHHATVLQAGKALPALLFPYYGTLPTWMTMATVMQSYF